MIHSTNINQAILDLNKYLETNNYFDGKDIALTNQQVHVLWEDKFRGAITKDIFTKFPDIEINFLSSVFELESENEQGGPCIYLHQILLCDKITSECLKAFIKTLLTLNKTTIYLDSEYANEAKWEGDSKTLKLMFLKMKSADKEFGYFHPITLADFL